MQIRNLQQLPEDVNFSTSLRDRRVSFWMFVFFKLFFGIASILASQKKVLKNCDCWRIFDKDAKKFGNIFLKFSVSIGAKDWKSCRSRKTLQNEYLVAKFCFDTAENEPSKV